MTFLLGGQDLVAKAGSRILFDRVTVGLADGDLVGLLGPNGAGKSTLLRILTGQSTPHGGTVTKTDGVEVTSVQQSDDFAPDLSVGQILHPGQDTHQWASQGRIRDIHAGLLASIPLDRTVQDLSGGMRRRVGLAQALVNPAQVVILDEPTNHLDVQGVAWLVEHLRSRFRAKGGRPAGALLVVTHDRWFLDEICTQIFELIPGVDPGGQRPQIPGRIEFYEGGYGAYILARAERERQARVEAKKRNSLLRKELAWLRRGAPARTSKPRFRIDAAETLIADQPAPRDQVTLLRLATARLGKTVINLENVSLTYQSTKAGEPDKTVLKDVTWRLAPGERVGIIGANGAGKTSLLNLLTGQQLPTRGKVKRGKTVQVAVLSQNTHELDELGHLRVVQAVAQVRESITVGNREISAGKMVELLGFTRNRAWTPVADISGGERRRLQLMRLLMEEPNVLLLDEPTNDLDTDTLAAIEDLLDVYAGTLVVVSHDRYLLERVTDRQIAVFAGGTVRDLPGGVEEYLQTYSTQEVTSPSGKNSKNPLGTPVAKPSENPVTNLRRQANKQVQKLAKRMETCAQRVRKVEKELAQVAQGTQTNLDFERLSELGEELKLAQSQLARSEDAWLAAAQELESLEN